MALREPESMDELVYFTQRSFGDSGRGSVRVWVFRQTCQKCGKELMGKPRDKSGKVRTKANEYVCPSCGHSVEKKEYEESLTANAAYTCAECGHRGESEAQFKRRLIEGVQTLRFQCGSCAANIDVTKKLKEKGKKSGFVEDV